jgi:hypothetical protein
MVRFANVVIAYTVIGIVMWGTGFVGWGSAGIGQLFIDQPGFTTEINEETGAELEQAGGPIQEAAQTLGGGALLSVWNLISGLIGFLFWPIVTLDAVNAPARATALLGGPLTAAFFISLAGFLINST